MKIESPNYLKKFQQKISTSLTFYYAFHYFDEKSFSLSKSINFEKKFEGC
jgi:hypothetical protein